MNRRRFVGTVATGLVGSRIRLQAGQTSHASPATTSLPRAQWLKRGIIDSGACHEPWIFFVRDGGNGPGTYDRYLQTQSETYIRSLKDQGIEVFHTHLYKGFGMAAEMPEMEDTKRVGEIVHRLGMKLDTYIQWDSLMGETFFVEEPRAKDWIRRDNFGRPIMYAGPRPVDPTMYRYRPCFSCQDYLDYLKKVIRYAVEEVKTDYIHFDNYDLNPEPESCFCGACTEGFRNFLRAKYTPKKRRERFGFERVDYVNPPDYPRDSNPENLEVIKDPVLQEWIDYRCQTMADALQQVAMYAKSMNPEVVIEVNTDTITGRNVAWHYGVDHARYMKWTEAHFTEEGNPAEYLSDGRLISKIRSYKLARTFRNVVMAYNSSEPVSWAECLAFNQTVGFVRYGPNPIADSILKSIEFYRKNRELFIGTEDVATVAVLRSYASIAYHNAKAQLSAILVEQTLIQNKVPFDLVFDEHLKDLSKYRVIVLPDSECLSDEQLDAIHSFINAGGGVVAIGDTGLYDEWRRPRVNPGLKPLAGVQVPAETGEWWVWHDNWWDGKVDVGWWEKAMQNPGVSPGSPVQKEVGRGRIVYLAGAWYDGPLPEPEPYFMISNQFWKRPRNWEQIIQEIHWASRGDMPVRVEGPDFLVINLVAQMDKRRMMLHLINYNAKNVPSVESVGVSWSPPEGEGLTEVTLLSPDFDGAEHLQATRNHSSINFTIPSVKTYSIAILRW